MIVGYSLYPLCFACLTGLKMGGKDFLDRGIDVYRYIGLVARRGMGLKEGRSAQVKCLR